MYLTLYFPKFTCSSQCFWCAQSSLLATKAWTTLALPRARRSREATVLWIMAWKPFLCVSAMHVSRQPHLRPENVVILHLRDTHDSMLIIHPQAVHLKVLAIHFKLRNYNLLLLLLRLSPPLQVGTIGQVFGYPVAHFKSWDTTYVYAIEKHRQRKSNRTCLQLKRRS